MKLPKYNDLKVVKLYPLSDDICHNDLSGLYYYYCPNRNCGYRHITQKTSLTRYIYDFIIFHCRNCMTVFIVNGNTGKKE